MKQIILAATLIFSNLGSLAFAKEIILDVRTPKEFALEHIQQALNIDYQNPNFKAEVAKLNRDDNYKVYCRSGRRSGLAVSAMKELGFKHLENVGGLEDAKKTFAPAAQ